MNKCRTKSGKMLHFALSIVVKYIHEKQVDIYIQIYTIKLKAIYFKCKAQ